MVISLLENEVVALLLEQDYTQHENLAGKNISEAKMTKAVVSLGFGVGA